LPEDAIYPLDLGDESGKPLDLYFQNDSPGEDKEANWLPAPKGPFCLRLYAPKSEALTGNLWKIVSENKKK